MDKKYVSLLKSSFTDDGKNDSWFIFCGKCVEEMFSIYTFLQQALILVLREIAEVKIRRPKIGQNASFKRPMKEV